LKRNSYCKEQTYENHSELPSLKKGDRFQKAPSRREGRSTDLVIRGEAEGKNLVEKKDLRHHFPQ